MTEIVASIIRKFKRWQFGTKKQLAFLEDLYTLINDGIPANRAVEMLGKVSTGINREVALSIADKIAQGQPMADGMRDWFSLNVVEVIRVGESGGALSQTMKSAINMLSQQGMVMGAFFGAISYPIFVLVIACAVIVYLNSQVFTQFRMIKPEKDWPIEGLRLVWVAQLVTHWWWILIVSIIALCLVFKFIMANYTGFLRPFLDRFPPFSFYRQLVAARLLETLGLLVANGVVFRSAIKVMQLQANPYLFSHLDNMGHQISVGKSNIGDVLDTGLVNEQDLMRLRVMAEVKGFEHGLIRMGIRGTEQVTLTMKIVSKVVGGIFLATGALLIIMIIQGIYLTGMSMGST